MNNMNDYLSQLIAMITGSGSAMAQPNGVTRESELLRSIGNGVTRESELSSGSVDGGMMDIINGVTRESEYAPMNTITNVEGLGGAVGQPLNNAISSGDIDGAFHTPEQLIEQKMRNSGNTPMPQGFDIDKVREMIRSQKMR